MEKPTGGSGMGDIHKQDLKMKKFLGNIGNIKTTHGENTSNVMNWLEKANELSNSKVMTASQFSDDLTSGFKSINSIDKKDTSTGKGKGNKGINNPQELVKYLKSKKPLPTKFGEIDLK